MKLHCLKPLVYSLCFVWAQLTLNAQDTGLQMHAVSIGPGIASSSSASAKTGIGLNFDISTSLQEHLLSFNFNTGLNLNSDGPDEEFFELNVTYGRKWLLAQNLYLEGHAGIGYFIYDIDDGRTTFFIDTPEGTLGFPIRAKLLLYPVEKFGIGLNPNLNLNSLETAYSLNLLFQYNFD